MLHVSIRDSGSLYSRSLWLLVGTRSLLMNCWKSENTAISLADITQRFPLHPTDKYFEVSNLIYIISPKRMNSFPAHYKYNSRLICRLKHLWAVDSHKDITVIIFSILDTKEKGIDKFVELFQDHLLNLKEFYWTIQKLFDFWSSWDLTLIWWSYSIFALNV